MTEHVQDWLSAFLDEELEPEDRDEVQAHLAVCSECRQELEELRGLDGWARRLPPPEPPNERGEIAAQVRSRLVAETARRRPAAPWLAAAAALAALVVVPWLLLQQSRRSEPTTFQDDGAAFEAPPAPVGKREEPPRTAAPSAPEPAAAPPASAAAPMEEAAGSRAKAQQAAPPPPPPPPAPAVAAEADRRDESADLASAPLRDAPRPGVATDEVRAQGAGADADVSGFAQPPAETEAEVGARPAASARERKANRAQGGAGGLGYAQAYEEQGRTAESRFQALDARNVSSASEARQWRRDWESYLRQFPQGRFVDRARFGIVRAAEALYRLERRPENLAALERAVAEYSGNAAPADAAAARKVLDAAREGSP